VMGWASIDGPPELAKDFLYGRTRQDIFGTEDSARKLLAQRSQKLWDFYHN
jgi:hypothetical protein